LTNCTAYEGSAILSTGEGGGNKYLREDGDGTCSWQTVAGGAHDAATLDANADTILSLSTQEFGLDTQTANYVFAGAVSGGAAIPAFRALVADDIPNLAASKVTSGTFVHERGGLEADVSASSGLVKITGGATSAVTVTAAGEAILDDADASAQRTTLGLAIGSDVLAFAHEADTTDIHGIADTSALLTSVAVADLSDGTVTAAELNLLDLAGLTTGDVLRATGAATAAWGAIDIVTDLSPQLGADLDCNGNSIHFGSAENTQTPAGTTATIDLGAENHHTLDCGSASGAITLTLTVPPGPTAGTIIIIQDDAPKDITWSPSSGSAIWLGTEPTWSGDTSKTRIVSWRWNATNLYLSATETN
jgi:hypothetical protein